MKLLLLLFLLLTSFLVLRRRALEIKERDAHADKTMKAFKESESEGIPMGPVYGGMPQGFSLSFLVVSSLKGRGRL